MKNTNKTAIVIGATGVVGSSLVDLLLKDKSYSEVRILVRRSAGISHPKLKEFIVNFKNPAIWRDQVKGDVLFSALGTTLALAGSKEKQYEIDYTFQYNTAKAARVNKVSDYVLISSMNADANASMFYPRIKGELEEEVSKLGFDKLTIMQPGFLYGKRKDNRPAENFAVATLKVLNKIGLFKNYKPIDGLHVAKATLKAHSLTQGIQRFTGNTLLYELAEQ